MSPVAYMRGMDNPFRPDPQLITSPDDPRIADYLSVRERDLTGRDGKFIIESMFVLDTALNQARFQISSILMAAHKTTKLADKIAAAHARGVPVYLAEQAVMDTIAGFHIHRGVLAIGHKPNPEPLVDLLSRLPERAIVLVGIGISNHDNVGGLFRNAAAFGADAVILDGASCDPFYRKAVRVSSGHVLTLPLHHGAPPGDIFDALAAQGITPLALSPAGIDDIRNVQRPERCALILGAEGPGLPADILDMCRTLRIQMADGVDSLNVATAAAVALSHLA